MKFKDRTKKMTTSQRLNSKKILKSRKFSITSQNFSKNTQFLLCLIEARKLRQNLWDTRYKHYIDENNV